MRPRSGITFRVLFLWAFFFGLVVGNAEYFSAITQISQAIEVGQQLASDLQTYLDLERTRLDRIRLVAKRLNTDGIRSDLTRTNPEDFFGNPINAYLTVKRLALDSKTDLLRLLDGEWEVPETTDSDAASMDRAQLAQVRARVVQSANQLPGDSDLDGAAEALLLLQATYQLSAEDIANGRLTADFACPKLSAAQCMHLGKKAYERGEYERAEEWFRAAYNRLWKEKSAERDKRLMGDDGLPPLKRSADMEMDYDFTIPDEPQPKATEILDHLAYALGRQGRYAEAFNVTQLLLEIDPNHERSLENAGFYQHRVDLGEGIVGPAPKPTTLSAFDQETETYQALCRGEVRFPPPPTGSLYCRYYVPHPYYKIGPVKEEVLYPDPRIVMWYDVIHPSEIERIQQLALPRLRRATVKNPVTGKLEFAFYRTSKSAWLPDDLDEITHRMNQRIHALTGLSMSTAEDLQVGNYGIGGYYAPHFDFGRKREKDAFEIANGNRIATIIFYLTEVKAGGGTAFNRIGAKVDPIRGAAGFWYNLYPSGEGDLRTRHVACPVLVGSKWVMNVWFHERGQEFRRPCGLKPDPIEVDDGF